jgi:hypothetical protein
VTAAVHHQLTLGSHSVEWQLGAMREVQWRGSKLNGQLLEASRQHNMYGRFLDFNWESVDLTPADGSFEPIQGILDLCRVGRQKAFAATCGGAKAGDEAALENASRFPLSLRTAAAGTQVKTSKPSSLLLETLT